MSQCLQSSGSIGAGYLITRQVCFGVDTVSRRVSKEAATFRLRDPTPPDSSPRRRRFNPIQLFLDVAVFGDVVCIPQRFWFEPHNLLKMISCCLQSIPECLNLGLEFRYVISGICKAGKARRHPVYNVFDLLGALQYHFLCCFHTEKISLCLFQATKRASYSFETGSSFFSVPPMSISWAPCSSASSFIWVSFLSCSG